MSLFSTLQKTNDTSSMLSNTKSLFGSVSTPASSNNVIDDSGNGWITAPFQVKLGDDFTSRYAAISWLSPGSDLGTTLSAGKVNKLTESVVKLTKQMNEEKRVRDLYGLEDEADAELLKKHNYQDTRVGGNDAMNNVWAFGEDDDISRGILTVDKDKGIGMGRVYASTTQQNQVIAWFTFGVPRFSKFSAFYRDAFDGDLVNLNTKGYSVDVLLGALFDVAMLSIQIPLLPIKWINAQRQDRYKIGRFYELRACMQLYYKYVDSMLAHWLVSAGLYMNGPDSDASRNVTADQELIPDALKDGASIWDIIRRKALNLGASAKTRELSDRVDMDAEVAEKIPKHHVRDDNGKLKKVPMTGSVSNLEYRANVALQTPPVDESDLMSRAEKPDGTNDYTTPASTTPANNPEPPKGETNNTPQKTGTKINDLPEHAPEGETPNGNETQDNLNKIAGLGGGKMSAKSSDDYGNVYSDNHGSWWDLFSSSGLGATQYIGFRIDRSVDASESFSNSTSPSEFAQTFNDNVRGAQNQQLKSILSGTGNTILDTLVGQFKSAMQAVGDTIEGLTGTDFLTNLGNAAVSGAYIDIPEQYAGSDFGKSHSINLQLRSPYGDMMSIYQSIIVPLSLILAGALPRAGGASSYVQPFLCRVYCKGMFSIPMGIIDNVSIKRGSSEFGWTYQNLPTCMDISISIKDMSPVMYMTISDGVFESILAQDTAFKEYMLTLSGVGLFERLSTWRRWQRNITYTAHKLRNQTFNPNYWAHSISQYGLVQMVSGILPMTTIPNK